MYVVPNNFGKVDTSTGEYKAPPGLKLGNDGKFQELPSKERGPASEKAPLPNIFTTRPEMAQFADSFGQGNDKLPSNAPQSSEQLKNIANERINTTETLRNNATNSGALIPTSRIKFIFNVK